MAHPFRPLSSLSETADEETASAITHGLGIIVAIIGLVAMILVSIGDAMKVVSASIFGATLVILYSASFVYHLVRSPKAKRIFQAVDHAAIYLLIAGTYTPVTLVTLRGGWGWSIFGVVWGLALIGVTLKALMRGNREHWLSTALYVLMGWIVIVAIRPLLANMPWPGIAWLVAGGICYTGGVAFFVWEKLRFHHAAWHLCVLAGSICHVIAVIFYVLR